MNKLFKKGDFVDIRGLDKSIIKAIIARFVADGYDGSGLGRAQRSLGITEFDLCHSLLECSKENQLSVEQVLFAGAPDWAVDVSCLRDKPAYFYWTDGEGGYCALGHNLDEPIRLTNKDVFNPVYTLQKKRDTQNRG